MTGRYCGPRSPNERVCVGRIAVLDQPFRPSPYKTNFSGIVSDLNHFDMPAPLA